MVELAVPDEVPRHRSGSGPRYPDEYRRNNIEGEVIVAFVIDTAGRIEPETFRVIAFSAPLFLSSVRSALRTMRFYPLVVDCSPRRMVGVQPFNFTLWR